MNRLNTSSSTLIYAAAADFGPGPVRRLVILISSDLEYMATMSQIADLALTYGVHVLLLGLCRDAAEGLTLRRELVTLSALLQDARVSAEANVEARTNWVSAVKSNYRAGDLIVCFAEQHTRLQHLPLSQILASELGAPVYILSTLQPRKPARPNWISRVTAWTGSAGIIAGTLWLQIQIMSVPKDWAQTTLLIVSVLAELWLIWTWNSLFG